MHLFLYSFSTEEKNYLIISSVYLPIQGAAAEGKTYKANDTFDGAYGGVAGKVKTEIIIEHPGGEVNCARYQPQNDLIIATKGPNPDVYIFDVSKHPSKYSKRRRSNVAVIIDRIVFIHSFLFYCLLLNHSFPTNPNRMTNCFQLILFYLQLYKLHLLHAFVYFDF